ncbi:MULTISPECIES: hypothetical protein [unclassified Streptomyces]|uniref:hypothetical protein n=1 Tax=unclassified Streptomyces TaxID=2593676 RepID=UPI002E812215|nr:hypothetical protein [Streptomyces sp. NBC_00569]WSE18433.1 hypothetical protein OG518_36660 [Streptomyces sp. NBC_01397]WUB92667.1 hypothetical protein OHO83_10350 [Streptomyces sp. NBC_00569]
MSIRSVHPRRTLPTQHSANAFAFGDRGGESRTCTPAPPRTASNESENFPTRSRRKNRNRSTLHGGDPVTRGYAEICHTTRRDTVAVR